ncbi:hypothetical protein BLNAU_21126 [Blattamonas nauphoetae]|uniref:Uncharacterized protein n=1 Tax=Blattamonas nauphoetae TaxID=2049346 RepID=A0ABQ9WWX4_9EUKA|nr:hypothetical protein BLNAU_21126 [Blattamonas nauphoetae]
MSGRPRPRHIISPNEFYLIIAESLNHQDPPRQQQPTYNQQVLVSEDGQADAPTLENRNKHEQPPGKDNDVQNPLVDSGRVVVAFPDQQKDFSPFLSQNEHSTVR